MNETFTPSGVGEYIKKMMERDHLLKNLAVEGEISSYTRHGSGHHYITLKDKNGVLNCVMFKGDASKLRFRPEIGQSVLVVGKLTVFPPQGKYQMVVSRLSSTGVGDLHLAFEQMKAQFEREGLFREECKKRIPYLPKRIAIITSPTGAVIHDMLRLLQARCPKVTINIVPVSVQGEGASMEIASAIGWVNHFQIADVIIVGRGGGSMEDLWAFNEEPVVRSIFHSQIPVISAVGHEPDVTIADYVADVRASTPSHATELVIPSLEYLEGLLNQKKSELSQGLKHCIQMKSQRLDQVAYRLGQPQQMIEGKKQRLSYLEQRLLQAYGGMIQMQREKTARLAATLHALSPLDVLGRGYAIPKGKSGKLLSTVTEVTVGDKLLVDFRDGTVECTADEIIANG